MACLDDETLDALVGGRLLPVAMERVDLHLDGCAECRELVLALTEAHRSTPSPAAATSEDQAVAGEVVSLDTTPGTRIGRFIALEPIGAGAMGVVYAAYDPKLDRRVALKLMRSDLGEEPERARQRMVKEARSMAQLSHPNVLAVYDVGVVGEAVFVAMELVDGRDARQWAAQERRSWREIREVWVQAAEGLKAAHAAGLVHRDLKPDNVIVGSGGRAWVGDFGLARAAPSMITEEEGGGPATAEPSSTQTVGHSSARAGTPAYMAPEVLAGAPADERSDQYSLCVAFYEALAGVHPFPASSMAQLVLRIEDGIEPPVVRSAPGWLLGVLARGMSVRPEDRFEHVDALLLALHRDRRMRVRVGVGVGALALVGATTGAFWLGQGSRSSEPVCASAPAALGEVWNDSVRGRISAAFTRSSPEYGEASMATVERALERWTAQWASAHVDTCEATHVRGEQSEARLDLRMGCLRDQLGQLDALTRRLSEPTPGVVEHAVDAVAALPPVEWCADVDALTSVMPPADAEVAAAVEAERPALAELRALVVTAQFAEAEAEARARVEAAERTGHAPLVAEARLASAQVAQGLGRLEEARREGYEALWAAERSRDDTAVARAWLVLMGTAGRRGHWDEAVHLGRHAEASVSRLGMPAALEATLRNGLGIVHEHAGDYERSRAELERALALRTERFGPEHPEVARVHTNLGNLARSQGRLDEALSLHRRALAIDADALGAAHPAIGRHHHNIARILLLRGAVDEARESYERALAIRTAVHGAEHPDVALTHNSLGLLYARQQDTERAREHYEIALRTFEMLEHGDRGLVLYNLGRLEAAAGDPVRALEQYRRAQELLALHDEGGSPLRVKVVLALADLELHLGRRAPARTHYDEAGQLARELGDSDLVDQAERGRAAAAEVVSASTATPNSAPRRAPRAKGEPTTTPRESDDPPPAAGAYGAGRAWESP